MWSCQWCLSKEHTSDQCPYVSRIEYYGSGAVKLVAFHDRHEVDARPAKVVLSPVDPHRGIADVPLHPGAGGLPQNISLADLATQAGARRS